MLKKLSAIVLAMFLLLTPVLGGCKKGVEEGKLSIRYFVGGYGNEWIISAANKYKELHPGVEIVLTRDQNINDMAPSYFASKTPNADLYMANDFNWQEAAVSGQIAEIDDVFESKVTLGGTEMKISESIIDSYNFYPYIEAVPGDSSTRHAYIMPWAANNVSIIYNADLMKKTPKTGGGTWESFPENEADFKTFINDINNASNTSAYNNKSVLPFVWAGSSVNVLSWLHTTWWAQYQGLTGENSYESFWQYDSPEIFNQDGIVEAYRFLQDIMIDTAGQKWKNTPANTGSLGAQDAEIEFVKGTAVMTINGTWLENEVLDILDESEAYPNLKEHLRMAYAPAINGAKTTNVNNVYARSLMAIHKNAVNIDLAKDFLRFLSTEQQLLDFTKFTGTLRPFKYNPKTIDPNYDWSPFQEDLIKMFFEGNNVFEGSSHPMYVNANITPYRPTFQTVFGDLLKSSPSTTANNVYVYATQNWDEVWKPQAGIV